MPMIGDKLCHGFNNNEECNYDGMDCCLPIIDDSLCSDVLCRCHLTGIRHPSYAAYGCHGDPSMLGDGVCDDDLNSASCAFDQGDCCNPQADFSFCSNCTCLEDTQWNVTYQGFCNETTVQDLNCDEVNNVEECGYDGGDCCRPVVNCPHGNCSTCHLTNRPHLTYEDLGCPELTNGTAMYGQGQCNDELNRRECFFDNGDCCLANVDDSACEDCICHLSYSKTEKTLDAWRFMFIADEGKFLEQPNKDYRIVYSRWGDGKCDEFANNKAMNYDGGDCCLPTASKQKFMANTDYSMFDVITYGEDEDLQASNIKCHYDDSPVLKVWDFEYASCSYVYRNGICDDFANHEGCQFDGGDCCLHKINTRQCEDCICHVDKQKHISYADLGLKNQIKV